MTSSNTHSTQQQFACLYTQHKTRKRKVWSDGRLVLDRRSRRAAVFEARPAAGGGGAPLDESMELTTSRFEGLVSSRETELETERFLVTVEGPWTEEEEEEARSTTTTTAPTPAAPSERLKRVLGRKFRRPAAWRPPPPGRPTSNDGDDDDRALRRRKPPLQPGELQRRLYPEHFSSRDSYDPRSSRPPPPLPHQPPPPSHQPPPPSHHDSFRRASSRPIPAAPLRASPSRRSCPQAPHPPHPPHPLQRPPPSRSAFGGRNASANDRSSSEAQRYLGEDEDDEEEDDDDSDDGGSDESDSEEEDSLPLGRPPPPSRTSPRPFCVTGDDEDEDEDDEQRRPRTKRLGDAPSRPGGGDEGRRREDVTPSAAADRPTDEDGAARSLSRGDLLALFGAAPSPPRPTTAPAPAAPPSAAHRARSPAPSSFNLPSDCGATSSSSTEEEDDEE